MAQNDKKYTLRERYEYHANIANSGVKPDGEVVSMCSRVNHAMKAEKIRSRRNVYLNGVDFGTKNKSKSKKGK